MGRSLLDNMYDFCARWFETHNTIFAHMYVNAHRHMRRAIYASRLAKQRRGKRSMRAVLILKVSSQNIYRASCDA